MNEPKHVHPRLSEIDEIPSARVLTAARARKGYHLNQFAKDIDMPM